MTSAGLKAFNKTVEIYNYVLAEHKNDLFSELKKKQKECEFLDDKPVSFENTPDLPQIILVYLIQVILFIS